ncbi:MAG: Na+/H+ antiporter NhaA [Actinomycetota bacterium]|nr:Na+/H+ antiporter NhaA [Actinomycetota bacterium]
MKTDDEGLHVRPTRPWLGPHRPFVQRMAQPVVDFLHIEAAGGVLLLGATVIALAWANSPWSSSYDALWGTEVGLRWGGFELREDLRHWVNDALMVLFFFVVGLEIKGEFVNGELRERRRAALPIAAAAGGMIVPAAVYLALNPNGPGTRGWGIPVATDIAFALGVVSVLRVPQPLKVFLLALAIVDDIGAILVIAVFYTSELSLGWLALAMGFFAVVGLLRWLRVWYVPLYVLVGLAVWLATFESGIHATIAGVALGLLTPARPLVSGRDAEHLLQHRGGDGGAGEARQTAFVVRESVPLVERLQDLLHPWTSYVVIPLFALANAGVTLGADIIADALGSTITAGVALGLLLGKPLGIVAAAWLAIRLGLGSLPSGSSWRQVAGVGAIAGIGFTMSLFIAALAFAEGSEPFEQAKIGIFTGSLAAAAVGFLVLRNSKE